jgi:hypothetical protein
MSGQIFISYRRDDASYPTGRLYDHLHSRFPQNEIFIDVDSIKPGIDFVTTIEERVGSCDVLIAVIGKRWLSSADEEGSRRLDNPEDFVRLEIGTALRRGIRVIPVLVEGALMPRSGDLPEDLKSLVRLQALAVSHDRFRADSERLLDAVDEVLEAARVEFPPRKPEEQKQRGRGPRQDKTEALKGTGAGSRAPPSNRTPSKEGPANLKRPWRLLVAMGIGVVGCLLGFGLFKATRPQPVSIGGPSSPTPAPLTASNSPSPTLLVSQASPSLTPSGAESLAAPASPVLVPTAALSNSPSPTPSGADWFAEAKRYLSSDLDPSLDYRSFHSSRLNLEFVYPQAQLTVDTTQEDKGIIPLLSPLRKVEVVIRRTKLPEHSNIRIGRDMEEKKVRDLGYSVNYLGPREEANWSDWYIVTGTKPDGSEYFYKRWYTHKDVVSIEFDYPQERLEVYNKIIADMTLKHFRFK